MEKLLGGSGKAPLVTALPETTPININTASAEVLTALAKDLSISDGEAMIEARGEKGFEKVDELLDDPILKGKELDPQALAVQSQWFLVISEANVGQGRVKLASLIQRTRQATRVVRRQREFIDPVKAPVVEEDEP
jgi:general secretion pathway protein K